MHESEPWIIDVVFCVVAEMIGQSIDQRARVIAVSGVHNKPGRLVDHQHRVILIYNVKWNIFGYDLKFIAGTVHDNLHGVERFDPVVAFYRAAIDKNTSGFGSLLDAVARCFLHAQYQKFVYPKQLLAFVGHKPEMLVEFRAVVVRGYGRGEYFVLCGFFCIHHGIYSKNSVCSHSVLSSADSVSDSSNPPEIPEPTSTVSLASAGTCVPARSDTPMLFTPSTRSL